MQAHAMLLLSSTDLPAKALVLNMKQFNEMFGCCYCEDEGKTHDENSLHRSGHTTLCEPMIP